MRWRVLIVRPWTEPVEEIIAAIARTGVSATYERADTRPSLLAALQREEWDLVMYDSKTCKEAPVELVYTHAPAAAVVIIGDLAEMTDELSRLAATRADISD